MQELIRDDVLRFIISRETHLENCLTVGSLLLLCILNTAQMCLEEAVVPLHSECL